MVQYFPVITGSLTVNGDIIVSGTSSMSASNAISSSLALDSQLLSGTGSVGFTTTGSFTAASSSLSSRTTQIESVYATTGSNSFRATQSITGSLTVTGQIIAQTLNVQQVTSSIVFSSGSNTFGCDLNSRQTFTGSVLMTGSLIVNTTGPELQVNNNGVILGNLLTDNHSITGSLRITGSIASFSNCVGIGMTPTRALDVTGTFRVITPNRSFFITSNAYSISDGTLSSGIGMDGDGLYLGNVASSTGWTIGNPQVTIRCSGNVGIGCTNPSFILDANDTNASGARGLRISTSSTAAGPGLFLYINSGLQTNWLVGNSYEVGNVLEFRSSNCFGGNPGTLGTSRMLITNTGNVTIATARTSGADANSITLSDNVTGIQTSGFGTRILATSNNGQAKSAIAFEADGGTNNDTAIAFYTQTSAACLAQRAVINKNGQLRVGTNTSVIPNALLSVGTGGFGAFGVVTQGQGAGTWDTGISVNQGNAGMAALLMASQHSSDGTSTSSALYLINFFYDGNNTPSTFFIAGSNFLTFGKSGSNTLTITAAGIALVQFTLMGNS